MNGPRRRRSLLGVLLAGWLAAIAAVAEARVVAIGDIHGAFDALVAILRESGLIDEQNRWSGGTATLVQTGDFLDRGDRVREVMELLMALPEQAAAAGGRVHVLLGNHEVDNMMGELIDTSPAAINGFAGPDAEALRRKAWEEYARWAAKHEKLLAIGELQIESETDWLARHPAGIVEYLRVMGPEGRYGRWLRSLPAIARIDGTLYLHGGLAPDLGVSDEESLHKQLAKEIERLDRCRVLLQDYGLAVPTTRAWEMARMGFAELVRLRQAMERAAKFDLRRRKLYIDNYTRRYERVYNCVHDFDDWLLNRKRGPLLYRGHALADEVEGLADVVRVLADWNAKRLVIAHSTLRGGRITSRFDGRVVLIDTGMMSDFYEGGRASALEIDGDRLTAVYLDGRAEVRPGAGPAVPVPPQEEPGGEAAPGPGGPSGEPQAAGTAATAPAPEARPPAATVWLDPDGQPLPFSDDEQVLEFLASAPVAAAEVIPQGVNQPLKLLLDREGVRAHAVFRTVATRQRRDDRPDRRLAGSFRDSALFECAAYELDRLLGLGRVPPTTRRSYRGEEGSVQMWVEGAFDEGRRRELRLEPPDPARWHHQSVVRWVFDALIHNNDRNLGNLLIDRDWNVWLIDHTRAFPQDPVLPQRPKITRCDRALWQRLRTLDRDLVAERLGPYLTALELEGLFARWKRLVQRLARLIDRNGEGAVLLEAPARG